MAKEKEISESDHNKIPLWQVLSGYQVFPTPVFWTKCVLRCPIALWGKPLKRRDIVIVFLIHLLVTSGSLRNIAVVEMS